MKKRRATAQRQIARKRRLFLSPTTLVFALAERKQLRKLQPMEVGDGLEHQKGGISLAVLHVVHVGRAAAHAVGHILVHNG